MKMRSLNFLAWLTLSVNALAVSAQGICTPADVTPATLAGLRAEMTLVEVSSVIGCVGEPSSLPVFVPVKNGGIAQTWTWGSRYPDVWVITVAFRNGRALAASGAWGPGLPQVRFGAEFGNREFLAQ